MFQTNIIIIHSIASFRFCAGTHLNCYYLFSFNMSFLFYLAINRLYCIHRRSHSCRVREKERTKKTGEKNYKKSENLIAYESFSILKWLIITARHFFVPFFFSLCKIRSVLLASLLVCCYYFTLLISLFSLL